jgi:hypothetical protein
MLKQALCHAGGPGIGIVGVFAPGFDAGSDLVDQGKWDKNARVVKSLRCFGGPNIPGRSPALKKSEFAGLPVIGPVGCRLLVGAAYDEPIYFGGHSAGLDHP